MAEIINIADYRPHLAGDMKCLNCKHKWVGVVELGDGVQIPCECPECGLMKGFYIHPAYAPEGMLIWKCNCGGELFNITTEGAWCISCGKLTDKGLEIE